MSGSTARALLVSLALVLWGTGCMEPNPGFAPGGDGAVLLPWTIAQQDGGVLPDAQIDDSKAPKPKAPDTSAPDLPSGSSGGLCDPCDPQQPACSEPGGLCLVVDNAESFCTRPCDALKGCPPGYTCMEVKVTQGSAPPKQCVPVDLSCTS